MPRIIRHLENGIILIQIQRWRNKNKNISILSSNQFPRLNPVKNKKNTYLIVIDLQLQRLKSKMILILVFLLFQSLQHLKNFLIWMGNASTSSIAQESAVAIAHRKYEIEFKQTDFIKQIEESIQDQYELLSPCLQQNQFYQLRKAIHIKTTLTRAVYIVNKYKIRSHQRQQFQKQIHKLKKIDHPAVPKIYQIFKNDHRFFVVFQYKYGESLASILEKQKYFDEAAAASVMWQLLGLLNHCHKRGIIHSDLKLTSVSFNSKKQELIRVDDLSISRIFRIEEIIQQSLGKAVLTAPQNVSGNISEKSDVWSCGIILYILLCGQPPIIANTKVKLVHKFKSFFLRFRQKRFLYVSEEGKELIRRMLRINPNQRPTVQQLMEFEWFTKFMRLTPLPQNSLRRCLKQLYYYKCSSKLQQATWIFFVNSLISFDQKQQIMAVFLKLDKSSKGFIDQQDLIEGYQQLFGEQRILQGEGYALQIMKRLRIRQIYFSQFLTYCANRFFLIRQANVIKIFQIFDKDNSGQIQISELRDTLGNSKEIGEEVWLQLIQEVDSNSDGKISYQEFNDLIRHFNYADKMSRLLLSNPFGDW